MAIIDTYRVFENLTGAGFDEAQAKALVGAVMESHDTVATKADLQAVKTDLQTEIADVRGEVQALAQRTEAEFASVRAEGQTHAQENRAEFASVRAEIQALSQKWEAERQALEMRMTIRLGTMMVIVAGLQIAFLVFLLALLGVLP